MNNSDKRIAKDGFYMFFALGVYLVGVVVIILNTIESILENNWGAVGFFFIVILVTMLCFIMANREIYMVLDHFKYDFNESKKKRGRPKGSKNK